jgi:hypothetical protein
MKHGITGFHPRAFPDVPAPSNDNACFLRFNVEYIL